MGSSLHQANRRRLAAAASAVGASLALGAATAVPAGARTLGIKDSGRLHETGSEENTIRERGTVSGSLAGGVRASLTIKGKKATASFTIYAKGGTITGHGTGNLKPGKNGYNSFGGLLVVTKGSGRFAGAKGRGHIYGSIDRLNERLNVQVDGSLRY